MYKIIINGSGGCGKDTFIDYFSDNVKTYNISTIDPAKEIAYIMGWDGIKNDKSRKLLSEIKRIGTEFNDYFFNEIIKKIDLLNDIKEDSSFIFIHCREPEEIEKIKNCYSGGCITLLIKRSNCEINTNESDKNVENYMYDFILDNNKDLKNLKEQSYSFYNFLTSGEFLCG